MVIPYMNYHTRIDMSKGTIIYVGNFELPDGGASANRVMANRKLFQLLGYRVAMLGIAHESFEGIRASDYDADIYEEAYPQNSIEWLKHMYTVKNIEKVLTHYSDVVMILLYNMPYSLAANAKRRFKGRGIQICYDCTEWTFITDGSILKRKIKQVDTHLIRTYLGKTGDGLIVISRMMQERYRGTANLLLLPPLVDVNDSIWHQEPQHNREQFEFCFAGMMDGSKESLDKIVEGYSLLNRDDKLLRIIGVTQNEFLRFYPNLRKLVSDLGHSILFMGRLSHRETIRYIMGCDCYIFIRQSDIRNNAGFPTKFVEAFTCGCPIITTDVSDIKAYVDRDNRGIVINSIDSARISETMDIVANNKKFYSNNKLSYEFHYEMYAEQTDEWIKKVIRRPGEDESEK